MKRRVCESCFFYDAAGIVNSGWCRHPDRQFSTGVRLVVRGNELNCRNGWNVDLWVPAGIEPGNPDDNGDNWPYADQQDDHLTSIVPARYESQESAPAAHSPIDDVVVRHTPYQEYAAPEKEARDLVTNPRAAIHRAREQFKVRQLREGRIADRFEHPPLVDSRDGPSDASSIGASNGHSGDHYDHLQENANFLGEGPRGAPRSPEYAVPPVSRDEIRRPYVSITHFPEDDQRFESIPDQFLDIPAPRQERQVQEVTIAPDVPLLTHEEGLDEWYVDELIAENGRPVGPPKCRRESFVDRLLRERRHRRHQEFEDQGYAMEQFSQYPEPGEDPGEDSGERDDDFGRIQLPLPAARYPEPEPRPRQTGRVSEPAAKMSSQQRIEHAATNTSGPLREPIQEDPDWAMRPFHEPMGIDRHLPEEKPGSAHQMPRGDDLPRWDGTATQYREHLQSTPPGRQVRSLSPGLPQVCRTCRDFRPAEAGDRGWCNNPWAFRHRRMVDAGVLSCGSSLGDWWIAHDGVWQRAADVSRHAQETPLLDRLLGIEEYSELPPPGNASGRGR